MGHSSHQHYWHSITLKTVRIKGHHISTLVGTLLLVLLVALAAYLVSSGSLKRLDYVIYDASLPLQSPDISDQIVVVSIDDNSLQDLGRWPWNRKRHAKLLEKLTSMGALAVGFDILFTDHQSDDKEADSKLAQALRLNKRSTLAIAPAKQNDNSLISELLPIPVLASSAAALGHVDVELDIDGLCRSSYLYAGIGDPHWPSFALALLKTGGGEIPRTDDDLLPVPSLNKGWVRKDKFLIPFTDPSKRPTLISYSDVLTGHVKSSEIQGKYVLIGATAAGLGDAISTPGAFSHERMPGVELNAQILNGLLQGKTISELSVQHQLLLTIILTLVIVGAILLIPLRLAFAATLIGVTTVLAIAISLLVGWQLWFPPTATMFAILLTWPLWSVWQFHLESSLRQRLLTQLDRQARYHIATGLPNHGMLEDRLRSLTEQNQPETGIAGLMVLHINWPGSASVVLDRPISDLILSTIGNRLRSITHENDFIAHLSGDDFAVLSTGYTNNLDIQQAASTFLAKLQEPLEHGKEKLLLAPQIGVSIWPMDTHDANSLLRNAYTAMFKSRIDNTEHLCIYSSSIGHELHIRSQLEQALIFALERGEFQVHYQPQVCAQTGKIIGVEALLRWHNPKLGWVSPDTFIPVAEHVGLIKKIGEWVIETACLQLESWNRAGHPSLRLAINVSPLQFLIPGLDTGIQRIIEKTGIKPSDIELEITESSLMHDVNNAIQIMHQIKLYGVELAIDDFGTGYSSLSSLRHFPIDRLKIDQSFTREIGRNADTTEITLTILAMAKQLGLNVIAEGVETQDQADFLRQHGCDEFQGYLYGRPVPAENITHLLYEASSAHPLMT